MRGIYFSVNNDQDGFRLPVNPEKVNVSSAGDGEKFSIAKTGKINIPKDVELEEYSLESYLPSNKDNPYAGGTFNKPSYYIDKLKKWRNDKIPVRYIYVKGSFTINEMVTIEQFDYDETGGSEDVNFTLSLLQHKPFGPKKMIVIKKASTNTKQKVVKKKTPPRQNKKPKYKTYSLKKGDSLWKVAQKYTGKGSNYPALAKLNNIKPSQYRKLPIGLKLKIPQSWTK